ncbi:LysR family transcriptional regulator [Xanthomonas citri]|uniref:LysR family transcriptional regulator n=1 Tax=Xanthomonas citri TaxID=346 RepID=UPI00174C11F4|nr:LysR family transcriptional regulator [Xanthomonas citri]MBD4889085.1 LysR family transcriptional regulator [Xanthomonas citri pv. citri]
MEDLNDFALLAAVVDHGSFSAAGRALGFPRSKVSRRVADLEQRLGVRLLQRSTRAVSLTEVGAEFYTHCKSITRSAQWALDVAERATQHPSGRIWVSCPTGVAHLFLAELLPRFLLTHPDVQVDLELTSRRVEPIAESIDVAIRVRSSLDDLVVLLGDHTLPAHQLHAVYPSRRGLAPGVRALIEFLVDVLPAVLESAEHGVSG